MQCSEEEMHAFGKTKQGSRRTENNDYRCEKYKQSHRSYKQIKSIEMIDQWQLQDKKNVP